MEEKIQHRIVKFKYAEYIGICQKNMLIISKKKTVIKKKITEYKKMQFRLYILPVLEVIILFNLYVIIVGNIVGKFPMGILTLLI